MCVCVLKEEDERGRPAFHQHLQGTAYQNHIVKIAMAGCLVKGTALMQLPTDDTKWEGDRGRPVICIIVTVRRGLSSQLGAEQV